MWHLFMFAIINSTPLYIYRVAFVTDDFSRGQYFWFHSGGLQNSSNHVEALSNGHVAKRSVVLIKEYGTALRMLTRRLQFSIVCGPGGSVFISGGIEKYVCRWIHEFSRSAGRLSLARGDQNSVRKNICSICSVTTRFGKIFVCFAHQWRDSTFEIETLLVAQI